MDVTIIATTHERLAAAQAAIAEMNKQGSLTYGPMTTFGFCELKISLSEFEAPQLNFFGWLTLALRDVTIKMTETTAIVIH
jgi:hypothetical protein